MISIVEVGEELKTICPAGFRLKKGPGAYYWERKNQDVVFRVGVSLTKYSAGLEFQSPTCRVSFPGVQEVLTQALVKILGAPPPGPDYSIIHPIYNAPREDNIDYSIFTRSMVTLEDAKIVLKEIERFNTLVSLPYFVSLDSFSKAAEFLVSLEPLQVPQHVVGEYPHLYAYLIVKEAKHPRFEEKRDEVFAFLRKIEAKNPTDESNTVYRRAFEELFY